MNKVKYIVKHPFMDYMVKYPFTDTSIAGQLNKNDIISFDEKNNMYCHHLKNECNTPYGYLTTTSNVWFDDNEMNSLEETGYIAPAINEKLSSGDIETNKLVSESNKELKNANFKLNKLTSTIERLRKIYDDRNIEIGKLYDNNKISFDRKHEHDTVYYNLTKLLNHFSNILK